MEVHDVPEGVSGARGVEDEVVAAVQGESADDRLMRSVVTNVFTFRLPFTSPARDRADPPLNRSVSHSPGTRKIVAGRPAYSPDHHFISNPPRVFFSSLLLSCQTSPKVMH